MNEALKPNETCVSVGWGEFSALLFKQTKEAKYIDALEKVVYNHLIGSLDKAGTDFGYYQPNCGKRITRTAANLYKCCRYRGFNAISKLNDIVFHEDEKDIIPMIYTASEYVNGELTISEETDYPFDDCVTFRISGNTNKKFKLRIPGWCRRYDVTVNNEFVDAKKNGGYVELCIHDGDVISLKLNTELKKDRVVIKDKKYVGFSYGSIVLMADSNICDDIYGAKDVESDFGRNLSTKYNIEFDSDDLKLVDYASAGKMHENDEVNEWILMSEKNK